MIHLWWCHHCFLEKKVNQIIIIVIIIQFFCWLNKMPISLSTTTIAIIKNIVKSTHIYWRHPFNDNDSNKEQFIVVTIYFMLLCCCSSGDGDGPAVTAEMMMTKMKMKTNPLLVIKPSLPLIENNLISGIIIINIYDYH